MPLSPHLCEVHGDDVSTDWTCVGLSHVETRVPGLLIILLKLKRGVNVV